MTGSGNFVGVMACEGVCIAGPSSQSDTIRMKKVLGGYLFFQNDEQVSISKLTRIMKPNEQAYKTMKAARTTNTWATIIADAGGFMVGWPLRSALAGAKPEWIMAGIGVGLIAVSIPITRKFNKQAKSAVDEYNGGLETSSTFNNTEIKMALTGNGIGLAFSF